LAQPLSKLRNLARIVTELPFVVAGSLAAGWFIGTAQHYIAWGLWYPDPQRFDFGGSALEFAALEGGITGLMAAIPTGLVAWYVILRRQATVSEVCKVVLVSLAGGCVLAAVFGLASAIMTPLLTEIVAVYTSKRRWVRSDQVSIPLET
jgi:hypothetical protein